MASITIIHKSNGDTEAHATGCRDIARKLKTPFFDGGAVIDAETTREVWLDYNSDYLAEGGSEAAWGIDFKPCCKLIVDDNRTYGA